MVHKVETASERSFSGKMENGISKHLQEKKWIGNKTKRNEMK